MCGNTCRLQELPDDDMGGDAEPAPAAVRSASAVHAHAAPPHFPSARAVWLPCVLPAVPKGWGQGVRPLAGLGSGVGAFRARARRLARRAPARTPPVQKPMEARRSSSGPAPAHAAQAVDAARQADGGGGGAPAAAAAAAAPVPGAALSPLAGQTFASLQAAGVGMPPAAGADHQYGPAVRRSVPLGASAGGTAAAHHLGAPSVGALVKAPATTTRECAAWAGLARCAHGDAPRGTARAARATPLRRAPFAGAGVLWPGARHAGALRAAAAPWLVCLLPTR